MASGPGLLFLWSPALYAAGRTFVFLCTVFAGMLWPCVISLSAAGVDANTAQLQSGTLLFQAVSGPDGSGDLIAKTVDPFDGSITGVKWRAARRLDERNLAIEPRAIFTFHDEGVRGAVFRYADISDSQRALLNHPEAVITGKDLVSYIEGRHRNDDDKNVRQPESRLGAIHSPPYYHNGVIYAGSDNGMLHAFDAQTGDELFAYIPSLLIGGLYKAADPEFNEPGGKPVVGGSFSAKDIQNKEGRTQTLLVGGLGKGGKGYFCLDVSAAKNLERDFRSARELVRWEFTDDRDLGYTTGRPLILNTRAGWAAVFGNGYGSENGEAVFYALLNIDRNHPQPFALHTGKQGENGIVGDVSAIDANRDGFADFLYAGDLKGNIWKVDIRDGSPENWHFAYHAYGVPAPYFTARCPNGKVQPVTTAVDITRHDSIMRPGFMLLFGTGRSDDVPGPEKSNVQSVYGIWDWQEYWESSAGSRGRADGMFPGEFKRPYLSNLIKHTGEAAETTRHLGLLEQIVMESNDEDWIVMSDRRIDYWNPETGTGKHLGWFFDLPNPGEQILDNPAFHGGMAVVVSRIPGEGTDQSGTSVIYTVDAFSGGQPASSLFRAVPGEIEADPQATGHLSKRTAVAAGMALDFPASTPLVLPRQLYVPSLLDDELTPIAIQGRHSGFTYWYIPDYGW